MVGPSCVATFGVEGGIRVVYKKAYKTGNCCQAMSQKNRTQIIVVAVHQIMTDPPFELHKTRSGGN